MGTELGLQADCFFSFLNCFFKILSHEEENHRYMEIHHV